MSNPGDTDVYTPPAGNSGENRPNPKSGAGQLAASRAGQSAAGLSRAGMSRAGGSMAGRDPGGTGFDTIVGRMVIEQGLATNEEVRHCIEQAKTEDPKARSLSQLLIDNEYITRRQLQRLRSMAEAEKSGSQIPGYKIVGKLGAGAMARVYKAKQISLDRWVAIKVLPEKFAKNPQFIQRFFDEGRAAAQLNHPNIVQAIEISNIGDLYFFVMEFVDGRTVHDDIVASRRYAEKDAIEVVLQVAEALDHAHERGLIHRDVKPKNVMITKGGVVKLADMGLARAISDKEAAEAEAGKAFGTPYYISPEQIKGEKDIGPPADIYSLGATLYHMVTGAVPFDGKDPTSVMHKHLKEPLKAPDHVNPKLTGGLSEVVEMMMAKKARDRYQSCQDLIADLRAVKAGEMPPLAHKDLGGGDFAGLLSAEASIDVEDGIRKHHTGDGLMTKPPVIAILAGLAISLLVNILLAALHFGG
ncbi:MAG: serine/threonine-protein kinase [Planctomycetota bacterium]